MVLRAQVMVETLQHGGAGLGVDGPFAVSTAGAEACVSQWAELQSRDPASAGLFSEPYEKSAFAYIPACRDLALQRALTLAATRLIGASISPIPRTANSRVPGIDFLAKSTPSTVPSFSQGPGPRGSIRLASAHTEVSRRSATKGEMRGRFRVMINPRMMSASIAPVSLDGSQPEAFNPNSACHNDAVCWTRQNATPRLSARCGSQGRRFHTSDPGPFNRYWAGN